MRSATLGKPINGVFLMAEFDEFGPPETEANRIGEQIVKRVQLTNHVNVDTNWHCVRIPYQDISLFAFYRWQWDPTFSDEWILEAIVTPVWGDAFSALIGEIIPAI